MGMDVYGKKPDSQIGEYFRRNVWGWRPLWDYVEIVAPELLDNNTGHFNDGWGLGASGAKELAQKLKKELEAGKVEAYVNARESIVSGLPMLTCEWCEGTGTRSDEVGIRMGMVEKKWCNGCDGVGMRNPLEASYFLSKSDVEEFAEFLEHSGGFEIW